MALSFSCLPLQEEHMLTRRRFMAASIRRRSLRAGLLAMAAQPATPVSFGASRAAIAIRISTAIRGKFPFFPGVCIRPKWRCRRNGGAAPGASHAARGHRHAERLRHRQLGHALRHEGARRRCARRGVIDDKTPDQELDAMARAGVRGIRLNLATGGVSDPAAGRSRFERPSSA